MDGRGGCCIARYAGGVYDMSKVNRIMLRFRPIAPKPSSNGSGVGSSSPEMSEVSPKSGRGKKRCNNGNKRGGNNNSGSSKKRKTGWVCKVNGEENKVDSVITTLPLLPETPEPLLTKQVKKDSTWLSFCSDISDQVGFDRTAVMAPEMKNVMASCVTVECVTDTWVDVGGLGCTDEEKRVNLERDTCPGMISDGYGRVTWTNEAYRRMVGSGQVAVWLVMKERVGEAERAFTCKVRVQNQNTCGFRSSITVPCDAWRMDNGGFAWRLDVNAALSLGR